MPSLIFNPDADTETTSVDGKVQRSGSASTFSTVRTSAGTLATDDATSAQAPILQSDGSGNCGRIDRGIVLFDTSTLPADLVEITSATLELYVSSTTSGFGGKLALVVTAPASNTALAASDYNIASWTMTRQATDLTISALTTSAYNTLTLNAAGIASIATSGITKFGLVTDWDADNSDPGMGGGQKTDAVTWQTAEGANKPKLTVTYTLPITGGAFLSIFQ